MLLTAAIKNIIELAPSRSGRVVFNCAITTVSDAITVRFTPTDQWSRAQRRLDEQFTQPFDHMELWHQTGLAVGSLEHFLTANNIRYTVSDIVDQAYIEVTVRV